MSGNSDFLLLCFLEKFGCVSQDLLWRSGENGYRRRHQASLAKFGKFKQTGFEEFYSNAGGKFTPGWSCVELCLV